MYDRDRGGCRPPLTPSASGQYFFFESFYLFFSPLFFILSLSIFFSTPPFSAHYFFVQRFQALLFVQSFYCSECVICTRMEIATKEIV